MYSILGRKGFIPFVLHDTDHEQGKSATSQVRDTQADNSTQIIQRVRSSVRSIIDLDAQRQNQGVYIYAPLALQLPSLTLCLQLSRPTAAAYA